ncbi:MAG: hypothetical protein QXD77_00045 [Candidatus Aenigmatarchaeota archaeon]
MAQRISGESLWMVAGIIIIIALMLAVFALLINFGPEGTFSLFQGIMSMIAMYLVSQLHAIVR